MPKTLTDVQGNVSPQDPADFAIGGNQTRDLISGMDGVVGNSGAVVSEIQSVAHDFQVTADRIGTYMDASRADQQRLIEAVSAAVLNTTTEVVKQLQPMIAQTTQQAAAEIHKTITKLAEGGAAIAAVERSRGGPGGLPGSLEDVARHQAPGVPSTSRAAPPNLMDQWQEYHSIGHIRQRFGESIQKHMQDHHGRLLEEIKPAGGIGPIGYRTTWDQPGRPVGSLATPDEISKFTGRGAIGRTVQAAAGGLAQGESVVGALAKGVQEFEMVGSVLEPIGIAAVAAREIGKLGGKIADYTSGQREANRQFQEVEGGGNFAAFAERGRAARFAATQRFAPGALFGGGMSGRQAEELFMGATRAYGGDAQGLRENALAFGVKMFKQLGMDIGESVKVIQTASKTGQDSLGGVADALTGVTKAAKDAGVNATVARQQFIGAWSQMSSTFPGGGAVNLARGATQAITGLGRAYAGIDISGLYSDQNLYQIAAMTGQSYNKLVSQAGTAGGREAIAGGMENLLRTRLTGTGIYNQQSQGVINQFLQTPGARQQLARGKGLDQAQLQALGGQLLPGLTDITSIKRQLDQLGIPVDALPPDLVAGFAAAASTGQFDIQGMQRTIEKKSAVTPFGGKVQAFGGGGLSDLGGGFSLFGESGVSRARRAYDKYGMGEIGKAAGLQGKGESPLLDALLKSPDLLKQVKAVNVETPEGTKSIDIVDAIRYYSDQLAGGQVTVSAGSATGMSLADLTKVGGAQGLTTFTGTQDVKDKRGFLGKEVTAGSGTGGGGGGKITIAATPQLQQFFQFIGQGSVLSPPGQASPQTLPTG
jgi:hypothetical protein